MPPPTDLNSGFSITCYKRAVAGTVFEKFRPDPRTQEIRQRHALLTTDSVGAVRDQVTRRVKILELTLDWNHCPVEGYGHSVVLADSCDSFDMERVHFVNCMPSDHPRKFGDMKGGGFRCECVMYSNAEDGTMRECVLTDSGYRPLSVSYRSKNIRFLDSIIRAENPVWRHVFCEVHGDGIPRDKS